MGPIFRRIAFAATVLICTVPALAQDKAPQPIPRFEDEVVPQIPPEITYADGKLRIVARQARLTDILDAIRVHVGAVVSVRPEIANQPVSLKIGPATPLDVINDLLEAADCDYIVVGSPDRPSGIRVVALPRAHEADIADFEAVSEANLKSPGNIPDEWNVTFTKPADEAESTPSPREPLVSAAEAVKETQLQTAPK